MKDFIYKFRFNLNERREFYSVLGDYLKSNINSTNAIESLRDRAKKNKDYRYHIYEDILDHIKEGNSISESMRKWIPENEYMLIESGEKSARLAEALEDGVNLSESIGKINKLVKTSLIMPCLLLLLIFGMIIGFRLEMVSIFLDILPFEKWTSNALIVYEFSSFVLNYWWIILAFFTGALIFIFKTISYITGPIRNILDKFPPYNIYKKITGATFLITFASLLKAGFPVNDALKNMEKNASIYLRKYIRKMIDNVSEGRDNGEALSVGLLGAKLEGSVEDRAKLSGFEDAIYNIGGQTVEKTIEEVSIIMKIVNMTIMVGVVMTMLFMFYSIIELSMSISEGLG